MVILERRLAAVLGGVVLAFAWAGGRIAAHGSHPPPPPVGSAERPAGSAAIEEEPADLDEPEEPRAPDAMQLFTLDAVLVVYPAGPGEDVERNRYSAERRAAYLDSVHGVRARVLPDDRVGPKDLAENLVLLGWNNRVLGTPKAPRPFERSEAGVELLGARQPDPFADLMFFYHSPYDETKFLYFWSRIDPESDRFMEMPWVGSNWAILRDYVVLRQGMFAGGSAWPPKRNPFAEANHFERLFEIEQHRKLRISEHYEIHYVSTDALDKDLDTIVQARETAFARAAAVFGKKPDAFRIRLFVYDSEEDKKTRTGVDDPAHSIPHRRELHMIRRIARNSASHEEVHLLAREFLGPCYLTSLYEGLALLEDGTWKGKEFDLHGAILIEKGEWPALADLLDEYRSKRLPEAIRFPASALLVGWVRATGGWEALRRIYGAKHLSPEGLAAALGPSIGPPDAAIRKWVEERARAKQSDLTFLKEQSAARDRFIAGDYPGVIRALERALESKPDADPARYQLATIQLRTGDYAAAEANLARILAQPADRRDVDLIVFSHYQMGRLNDVRGRREDALSHYRRMLELPDRQDSHHLAREAIETPATRESLE